MADDNTVRAYRTNEPYRRPAAPAAGDAGAASDPLAELARLIGQNDPFAELGRGRAQGAPARDAQHGGHGLPASADWRQPAAASDRPYDQAPGDRYFTPHSGYRNNEPPYSPSADEFAPRGAAADPRYEYQHADDRYDDRQYDNPVQQAPAHDDGYEQSQDGYQGDSHYNAAPQAAAHDEEIYDDAPRARRRGGMVTAVVLIGCAMVGSGAAYGYRTWYANPSRLEAPPVIAADKTPSKIAAAGDSQAGKVIQDRVGGSGAPERVVSREEQPVALKDPGASAPRVVLAAPVAPSQMPAAASAQPAAPATAAPGEPKRVRTVTIRPDGSEARAAATPASPFPPAPAQALTPPAAQSSAAPAARATTPQRAAAPSRNSPLSLNPQANEAAEPLPPAPRSAAVTPAPTRISPNAAASATGSYVVQVSSQRSEAEAQASFRSLQGKFPGVLGGRQALVRRADLGEKGTFYRAMVGPFGSSEDATRFCGSLKAAGGQCIIQRN